VGQGRFRIEEMEKGNVGYNPHGYGHSIENTGDKPCRVLIGFNAGVYETIDLSQWIAGNPLDVLATNFSSPQHFSRNSHIRMFSSRTGYEPNGCTYNQRISFTH
jgi:oxalate decarboxylase/phosphoglucose isomerase-like protein (cupin superfamily)